MGKRIRVNGKLYESVGRSMNESSKFSFDPGIKWRVTSWNNHEVDFSGVVIGTAKELDDGRYSVVVYGGKYDRGVKITEIDNLDELNDFAEQVEGIAEEYKKSIINNIKRFSASDLMGYDPYSNNGLIFMDEIFTDPVDFLRHNYRS